MNTKIEVIIPAYNCSSTISTTLSSLASQLDKHFHVLVVDDCSTENIYKIVEQFQDRLNIRYIRNEKNLGCGMTRQVGIDNTECEYFTFLDSDDVFMPYTIGIFNGMIKSNPSVEMFHSYFYQENIQNGLSNYSLIKDGYTWCHGKLYKTEYIKKYNIKNQESIMCTDDGYFNAICAELTTPHLIPITTMIWVDNKKSITRNPESSFSSNYACDYIYAMKEALEFVLQYKKIEDVRFIGGSLQCVNQIIKTLTEIKDEKKKTEIIKNYNDLVNILIENNYLFLEKR